MDSEFWTEMASLENRFETMFRSLGLPGGSRGRPALVGGRPFAPATDVLARNGDWVIRMDLPGVDPAKDVTVSVDQGRLVVHGERKQHKEIKEKDYYRSETVQGAFERYVPLPKAVDQGKITASYVDGVLEIVIPDANKELPAPKAKQIPIKATSAAGKA